jgi:SAM-dependent methyltransferase
MQKQATKSASKPQYTHKAYWHKRSDMLYYQYIDYIVRTIGRNARTMIDVGSGSCPYLDWFDWIPRRISIDPNVPYNSPAVVGIKGDIFELPLSEKFDLCSCLQVLEHIPDPISFAKRLSTLARVVLVSVPYKWSNLVKPTRSHLHDPVTYEKLTEWFGREANYKIVVREPFLTRKSQRLIAIYDSDQLAKYDSRIVKGRRRRKQ